MITSTCELAHYWRLMKVKYGCRHIGGINKIGVIERNGLSRNDIRYSGPKGGNNEFEIFAFIKGHGRILYMRDLTAVAAAKKNVEILFKEFNVNTGKERTLSRVKFKKGSLTA